MIQKERGNNMKTAVTDSVSASKRLHITMTKKYSRKCCVSLYEIACRMLSRAPLCRHKQGQENVYWDTKKRSAGERGKVDVVGMEGRRQEGNREGGNCTEELGKSHSCCGKLFWHCQHRACARSLRLAGDAQASAARWRMSDQKLSTEGQKACRQKLQIKNQPRTFHDHSLSLTLSLCYIRKSRMIIRLRACREAWWSQSSLLFCHFLRRNTHPCAQSFGRVLEVIKNIWRP